MRDTDITALAQYEGRLLGSEQGLFLGTSAPLGQRSGFADRYQQGRTLKAGEHFTILIENNGPGGFYTELARTMVFGKASQRARRRFRRDEGRAGLHALPHQARRLVPRHRARRTTITCARTAFPPELRLYCHGQGYDLVERPLVRADETMTLAAGMNLAVHPGYETDAHLRGDLRQLSRRSRRARATACTQTEKKIFEL